jgi:predicted dehydrogenase
MDIVVIGLGSMGKRRIRLMKELYPDIVITGVDGQESRRIEASEMFGIDVYASLAEIDGHIDCAFVCTSPLSHAAVINECLGRKWHVFTEINLVDDGYDDNIQLAHNNGCVLFLSSTFLYREETRYIRERVVADKKWNYIYHIGQYLPDWHPWENYKDFFIGDSRTNGCREIFAIELPWLVETFGPIKESTVISDKMSELNISYNDNYLIQLKHANGNKGILAVDVVSPVATRSFEAYSENAHLSWGGTPDSVREYDPVSKIAARITFDEEAEHKEGYSSFIIENAYKNEIIEFFEVVKGQREALYGFEKDREILRIIDTFGA